MENMKKKKREYLLDTLVGEGEPKKEKNGKATTRICCEEKERKEFWCIWWRILVAFGSPNSNVKR